MNTNEYPVRGSERISQLRPHVGWSVGNCGHRWLLKHIWRKSGSREKLSDTKEFNHLRRTLSQWDITH